MISVIIPTYNRFEPLKIAIQSVLDQTYKEKEIEIIVVNDASTDERYYNGELEKIPHTIVKHLPVNLRTVYNCKAAQGKTRDEGVKIAKGEWICFLDDDDAWYSNKLERQFEEMKKYPFPILFCSTQLKEAHGSYHPDKPAYIKPKPKILLVNRQMMKIENYISNSSVLIHKSICDKVGEFKLGIGEDYDYWCRILDLPNMVCLLINEGLMYYDLNHGNGIMYSR